jgi:hypothetical protein
MAIAFQVVIDRQSTAHDQAEAVELAHLRTLSLRERGRLIEAACEAASLINQSRLASGLPDVERAPWPESTWQFLRKQAARARG